jgi:hypothetical protein
MIEQLTFPNFGYSDELGIMVISLNYLCQNEAWLNPLNFEEDKVIISAKESFEYYKNLRDSMNNLRLFYSEGLPAESVEPKVTEVIKQYLDLCLGLEYEISMQS